MAERREKPNLLRAIFNLNRENGSPPTRAEAKSLEPELALLRSWQVERLAGTYADFLADERYRSACSFFVSDIYAARDFSQRDRDFEHLYETLTRILPEKMLHLLKDAILLNQMTQDLDKRLLSVLINELGMVDTITAEDYVQAYRLCDNYAERVKQIERLVAIVREVGVGAHLPLVGPTLRVLRVPAQRLGWFDLYDFLERGYRAFLPMKDVQPLARAIDQRELRILNRIYAGDQQPFAFAG